MGTRMHVIIGLQFFMLSIGMSHSVSSLRTGDNERTECVKSELSIHNCNQANHAGERSFAVPL